MLGPDAELRLTRLRQALMVSHAFELIIVTIDEPALRDIVIDRVLGWSGRDGVPVLARVELAPGVAVMEQLGRRSGGVIVTGLDGRRQVDDERSPDMIAELNWHRDELPSAIAGPMILVIDGTTHDALFERAPDLYSWRRHSTDIAAGVERPRAILPPTDDSYTRERDRLQALLVQARQRTTPADVELELLDRLAELELDTFTHDDRWIREGDALASRVAAKWVAARHHLLASRFAVHAGQIAKARALIERAVEHLAGDDQWLAGELALARGDVAADGFSPDVPAAVDHYDRAVAAFLRAGDSTRALLAAERALYQLWATGRDAPEAARRLIELLDRPGDPVARWHVLRRIAATAMVRGAGHDVRHAIASELTECAKELDDPEVSTIAATWRQRLTTSPRGGP